MAQVTHTTTCCLLLEYVAKCGVRLRVSYSKGQDGCTPWTQVRAYQQSERLLSQCTDTQDTQDTAEKLKTYYQGTSQLYYIILLSVYYYYYYTIIHLPPQL